MYELANILDLPLELTDEYIFSISKIVDTLAVRNLPRGAIYRTRSKNRRLSLVIDPSARIVHYESPETPNVIKRRSTMESNLQKPKQKSPNKKSKGCLDTKIRYTSWNLTLIAFSLVLFGIFSTVTLFTDAYDLFGPGLLFGKGAALVILIFTMLAMFFVSYDLTTWLRGKLKGKWSTLFDFQILFHRFCGYVILIYSVIHTIGHLTGSYYKLNKEKDMEKINEALTYYSVFFQ